MVYITKNFSLALLGMVFNVVVCFVQAYYYPGKARGKYFNSEFLASCLTEHKEAFPEDTQVANGGYPDNGSGRYSEKLGYKEWFLFNCA